MLTAETLDALRKKHGEAPTAAAGMVAADAAALAAGYALLSSDGTITLTWPEVVP